MSTASAHAHSSTGSRVSASSYGDTLPGSGAVHFDYQPGNVLVHPDRPDKVTAIVDWAVRWPVQVASTS